MCKTANVSKSGYYKWLKNIDKFKYSNDLLLVYKAFF